MFPTGSQDSRRSAQKASAASLSFRPQPPRNSFIHNARKTHLTISKPRQKATNTSILRNAPNKLYTAFCNHITPQRFTNKMQLSRIFVLTNILQMCYASEADMRFIEWRPHWSAQSTPRARTKSSTEGAERSPHSVPTLRGWLSRHYARRSEARRLHL